jgi:hypothetical protein
MIVTKPIGEDGAEYPAQISGKRWGWSGFNVHRLDTRMTRGPLAPRYVYREWGVRIWFIAFRLTFAL